MTTILTPSQARARAQADAPALLAEVRAGTVQLDADALLAAMAVTRPAAPAAEQHQHQPDASVFRRFRFESDAQYSARVSGMLTRAAEAERIASMSRPWEPPPGARAEWPIAALGGTGRPPAGVEAVVEAMETPGFGVAPVALLERDADLSLDQLADQVDQLMGGDGARVVMPPQRQRAVRPTTSPEAAATLRAMTADEVERLMEESP